MNGSGHRLPSEQKAATLASSCAVQCTSCPIKKRLCPTEPFDLKVWILAAGVFYFSFSRESYINHLFLQGNGTSHHYGIPSVTGVESKKRVKT